MADDLDDFLLRQTHLQAAADVHLQLRQGVAHGGQGGDGGDLPIAQGQLLGARVGVTKGVGDGGFGIVGRQLVQHADDGIGGILVLDGVQHFERLLHARILVLGHGFPSVF
ncbi:MAG: hypothetical protein OZX49_01056 [Immundisolibacter sp.]|nr:hypothetical protein [Immundisolibacter sp.]